MVLRRDGPAFRDGVSEASCGDSSLVRDTESTSQLPFLVERVAFTIPNSILAFNLLYPRTSLVPCPARICLRTDRTHTTITRGRSIDMSEKPLPSRSNIVPSTDGTLHRLGYPDVQRLLGHCSILQYMRLPAGRRGSGTPSCRSRSCCSSHAARAECSITPAARLFTSSRRRCQRRHHRTSERHSRRRILIAVDPTPG